MHNILCYIVHVIKFLYITIMILKMLKKFSKVVSSIIKYFIIIMKFVDLFY